MPMNPIPPSAAAVLAAAQAELQAWRTAHPAATFYEIEVTTERCLARVRAALVAEVVQAGAGATTECPVCPTCGEPMQQVGQQKRTITLAYDEAVTLQGPRYRCPACRTGLFPPR